MRFSMSLFCRGCLPRIATCSGRVASTVDRGADCATAARPQFKHAIFRRDLRSRWLQVLFARNGPDADEAGVHHQAADEWDQLGIARTGLSLDDAGLPAWVPSTRRACSTAIVPVASGDPNLSQRIKPDGTIAFENEDRPYDGTYATRAVPGDPRSPYFARSRQVAKSGIKRSTAA